MCNLCVMYDHTGNDVANLLYSAILAGQHRGQESSGIAISSGRKTRLYVGKGEIGDVFKGKKGLRRLGGLEGHIGLGHNRYATTGKSGDKDNFQPMRIGDVTIGLNGNTVNVASLRERLEEKGVKFNGTTDTEVIAHRLERARGRSIEDRVHDALSPIRGAYCLGILFSGQNLAVAVRDPWGFRPLVIGRQNGAYVVSSETCSLKAIQGTIEREVAPGEMVILNEKGVRSVKLFSPKRLSKCIFEQVYFARPDSIIFGVPASLYRFEYGRATAREHPVEADVVVAVPDSANEAAEGFAEESGIPKRNGLVRNHYIGRTFIEPRQDLRLSKLDAKFGVNGIYVNGKRVVIIDDSIVRANTSKKLVKMLRAAGAIEVHVRIASPPITDTCSWGMDFPSREELGYHQYHGVEGIRKEIEADSLGYLSKESLIGVSAWVKDAYSPSMAHDPSLRPGRLPVITDFSGKEQGYCTTCFSGKPPMDRRGSLRHRNELVRS